MWWDDVKKKLGLVELTSCFEASFNGAAERKRTKYEELHHQAEKEGYKKRSSRWRLDRGV